MKKIALAGTIIAAALTGAIVGITPAEAAQGGTATLTPEECVIVLQAWPSGSCDDHMQNRVDRLVEDARRQRTANRAAGVALLDVADVEALDAKIKAKKDEKAAAEEIE